MAAERGGGKVPFPVDCHKKKALPITICQLFLLQPLNKCMHTGRVFMRLLFSKEHVHDVSGRRGGGYGKKDIALLRPKDIIKTRINKNVSKSRKCIVSL